jgi:hypothetical protein
MQVSDAQEVAFIRAVRRMTDAQREMTRAFMEAWTSGRKSRDMAIRFAKAFNDDDEAAAAFADRVMEAGP